MDESRLVSTLGKKYNIDVSNPEKIMELFNKLCVITEAEAKHKALSDDYAATVSIQNKKIGILSKAMIDILYSEKLSSIVKGKIKNITKDHSFEITVKGGEIKICFPG